MKSKKKYHTSYKQGINLILEKVVENTLSTWFLHYTCIKRPEINKTYCLTVFLGLTIPYLHSATLKCQILNQNFMVLVKQYFKTTKIALVNV